MVIVQEGERALLVFEGGFTALVEVRGGGRLSTHRGIVHFDDLLGQPYGAVVKTHQGGPVVILQPSLEDLMMKVRRRTTIIYPKEAAAILMRLGIGPGSRVLEVGTGSGALTLALAWAVAPTGQVLSYEVREDMLLLARENVGRTPLAPLVEIRLRHSGEPFPEGMDAAVLDIPTPWEELAAVRDALRGGGRLASLNPTFNQVERMAGAMIEAGFVQVDSLEILYRPILARPGRTRPVQRMVAHTEFLTFGARSLGGAEVGRALAGE